MVIFDVDIIFQYSSDFFSTIFSSFYSSMETVQYDTLYGHIKAFTLGEEIIVISNTQIESNQMIMRNTHHKSPLLILPKRCYYLNVVLL